MRTIQQIKTWNEGRRECPLMPDELAHLLAIAKDAEEFDRHNATDASTLRGTVYEARAAGLFGEVGK